MQKIVTPCIVEGCENIHHAKGWCRKHYLRAAKYGDPLTPDQRGLYTRCKKNPVRLKRVALIVKARRAGRTYADIARKLGISPERVYQIAKATNAALALSRKRSYSHPPCRICGELGYMRGAHVGLCKKHAWRVKLYGDPLATPLRSALEKPFHTFLEEIDGHQLWRGPVFANGLPCFHTYKATTGRDKRRSVRINVQKFVLGIQREHSKVLVQPTCGEHLCVRLEHLSVEKRRSPTCRRGHPRREMSNKVMYCPTCKQLSRKELSRKRLLRYEQLLRYRQSTLS